MISSLPSLKTKGALSSPVSNACVTYIFTCAYYLALPIPRARTGTSKKAMSSTYPTVCMGTVVLTFVVVGCSRESCEQPELVSVTGDAMETMLVVLTASL